MFYFKTVEELWKDIEVRFWSIQWIPTVQPAKKDKLTFLRNHTTLQLIIQKIKGLQNELDTLNTKTIFSCNCDCDCGEKEKMVKVQQDERFIQFFMEKDKSYVVVRSNILMIFHLSSISLTYSSLF